MQRLSLMLGAIALTAAAALAAPEIGEPAPDFTLTDAHGTPHQLSEYQGRVVVLEWTNPDCPYVVRHYEEGTMVDLEAAHADSQVVWLAVNTTHYNTAAASQAWSSQNDLAYPTLIDSTGQVGRLYNARTTPHMFVIDAAGTLVYDGAIDDDPHGKKAAAERQAYVAQAIQAALSDQTPATVETRPYGCSVKYAK